MSRLFQAVKSNCLTRRVLLFGTKILSILNRIVPKDPKRILFYESTYDQPSDNTEAFCSWLIAHGYAAEYQLVYCVTNSGTVDPLACRFVGKPRGVLEYLRSSYVFYSFGGMRITPAHNQVVVNLWHGTPLKVICKLMDEKVYGSERLDDFTYVLSASERFKPVVERAFECDFSRVLVQGFPRCDYLVRTRREDVEGQLEQTLGKTPQRKHLVLWMPTFRKSFDGRFDDGYVPTQTNLPVVVDSASLDELDEAAARHDCLIVIKRHGYDTGASLSHGNIVSVDNDAIFAAGLRLYEFVACFDALITDYSSIAFDYMLLDRPIAYTVDDIESYQAKRGFTVDDPLALMPGPKMETIGDMEAFLDDVEHGRDSYGEERRRVRDSVNDDRSGNFCRSLAEKIGLALSAGSNEQKETQ